MGLVSPFYRFDFEPGVVLLNFLFHDHFCIVFSFAELFMCFYWSGRKSRRILSDKSVSLSQSNTLI